MPKRTYDELPPFSTRFKALQERAGMKNLDIAHDMGMHESQVSRWRTMSSHPVLPHLILIADYFEVTLDQLVGREDFPWEASRPASRRSRAAAVGQIDEELAGDGRARRSPRRGSAAGA